VANKYNLCLKLCHLEKSQTHCFNFQIDQCYGACNQIEPNEVYNERVDRFIEKLSFKNKTFGLIDYGRTHDERSVILVKNGHYAGYGYIDLNYQISNIEILENIITPAQNFHEANHIIQSFIRTNKKIKLITFK
jgi:DNA polymerase-3 subunit epsilon